MTKIDPEDEEAIRSHVKAVLDQQDLTTVDALFTIVLKHFEEIEDAKVKHRFEEKQRSWQQV